jgi:hypothetical protein
MKKTVLIAVFCAAVFSPAQGGFTGGWSWAYWYCPISWSEAKVYWNAKMEYTGGYGGDDALYIAGEGPLPDSNEGNTIKFPFSFLHGGPYQWTLPWREDGPMKEVHWIEGWYYSIEYLYLKYIEVANGITHIGNWWFGGVSSIENVNVRFALTLQSIGEGAFKGCDHMPIFECSNSVKTIGNRAFEGCSNLHEFNVYDPTGNYKISEAPLNIGNRAFADCKNLKYFNITAYSTLGDEVFSKSGLESVDFKPGISFGKSVFKNCSNLKSITIPANYIFGDEVFANSLLETVTVNDNVNFGKFSFQNCKNLKSITFQGKINAITDKMFEGCSSLSSVNIPNSITSIGNNAFQGCSSLQTVNIPTSITSIGNNAFQGCSSLQIVHIPNNNITSIGDYTFQNCTALTDISLPTAVEYLGKNVFQGSGIKSIDVGALTPPSVNDETFVGLDFNSVYICVPSNSVDAYRAAAGWKNFKNIGAYPAGIRLDKHSVTARGNTALKLNAYLMPYNTVQDVRWHTKNINVAEVNNGTVRFKSPGTAAIVATTHNGIFRDSCLIRVLEDNFNLDGRPTLADSLLGEWVQCDENFQDYDVAEIFGFWKTVTTLPEGYQTISLNCRYNNGAVERTVDRFSIDETAGVVYIHTTARTYMSFTVIKLTANTITARNIPYNDISYWKRVK